MTDTIGLRFKVGKDLHKELKLLAVQSDTTLQKLLPVLITAGMTHHAKCANDTKATKHNKSTKSTKTTKRPISTDTTDNAQQLTEHPG